MGNCHTHWRRISALHDGLDATHRNLTLTFPGAPFRRVRVERRVRRPFVSSRHYPTEQHRFAENAQLRLFGEVHKHRFVVAADTADYFLRLLSPIYGDKDASFVIPRHLHAGVQTSEVLTNHKMWNRLRLEFHLNEQKLHIIYWVADRYHWPSGVRLGRRAAFARPPRSIFGHHCLAHVHLEH